MKKAQLTFFIFFGFAIVLAISIAITIMTDKTAERTERGSVNKPKTMLKIQPIKDAVNNCLTITAKEALIKIGKQSGYLYQNQGGSTEDLSAQDLGKKYAEYDDENVRYLVDEPTGNIGQIFFTTTPKYPWDTFPYTNNAFDPSSTQHMGYYGINQLPGLYKPAPNSIQEQLETYTANNTKTCIDFSKFEQQGLEIKYGNPNATAYIANETKKVGVEEAVYFTLNWPITIKEKTTNITTTIQEFGTIIKIPFAKIYYNISTMLNKDATNISYEPHTEGEYIVSTTKIEKNSIVSTKFVPYTIDNKQYMFTFARHNRQPALHYITQLKDSTRETPINLPKGAKILIEGTKLKFIPASCDASDSAINKWDYSEIGLNASDPDGELNNQNILFKLNPANPVLDRPTGNHPIEIELITQKIDDTTKKDLQTFYVNVYCCADAPCQ